MHSKKAQFRASPFATETNVILFQEASLYLIKKQGKAERLSDDLSLPLKIWIKLLNPINPV